LIFSPFTHALIFHGGAWYFASIGDKILNIYHIPVIEIFFRTSAQRNVCTLHHEPCVHLVNIVIIDGVRAGCRNPDITFTVWLTQEQMAECAHPAVSDELWIQDLRTNLLEVLALGLQRI